MPNLNETGEKSLDETLQEIARLKSIAQTGAEKEGLPGEAPEPEPAAQEVPTLPAAASEEIIVPSGPSNLEKIRRLLEREAAVIKREQELSAKEKTLPTGDSLAALKARFRLDRLGVLRELDPEFKPNALAKELFHLDLGDLAPPEARAQLTAQSAAASVEALRAEMEANNQKILQELQFRQEELARQQYVGSLQAATRGSLEEAPLTKKYIGKSPDKVVQALFSIAQKHAQATGGEVLTPAQTITKLEDRLKDLASTLGATSSPPPTTTQPTAAPAASVPKTIRNKDTVVQPNRTSSDDEFDDEKLNARFQANLERAKRAAAARLGST